MISQELKDQTKGRWKEILTGLGVDQKLLNGYHQPCPFCGGVDRFRFTNHEGEGFYYCNQCGSGTAFHLAAQVLNKDYGEVCKMIEVLLGSGPLEPVKMDRSGDAEKVREIWKHSLDLVKDDPVCRYLIGRGINTASKTLKFNPGVFDGQSHRSHPSMVAPIMGPTGEMLGVHITHLENPDADKWIKARIDAPKKQRKIAGTISGGAIRLFDPDPDDGVGIAEGIETALAVRQMWKVPCWSVMNATGIEKFKLPDQRPRRITIYADNDKNFVGLRAAYNLAHRLVLKDDYHAVFVERPLIIGDYLDELNATYLRSP